MGRFGQGQPFRRVEDRRLLTGAGRYTADFTLPGQAHAAVVRSPFAHGDIVSLDVDAARRAPGVLAVLTEADLAAQGIGHIPCGVRVTSTDGREMQVPPYPALARDRVRHVGQPVALVVAETLHQARDAAELVELDVAPLPAVVSPEAAVDPDAPQLWAGEAPGNVMFDRDLGDRGATEAAFAAAARIVRLDLVNQRIAPTAMEARGCVGDHSAETGRFTLITGSQGSHTLRRYLAEEVFRQPEERFRVIAPDVGGGFGMRLFLFPEHVLVLVAARMIGRPVRWIGDRSEAFLADTHGRDHVSHSELALDGDGRILGLRVETLANLGAYLSQFGCFVAAQAGPPMLPGVYDIAAVHVRVRGVVTNTSPVDAYRGAGRPEATYLIERLADKAAREIGMAPDAFRRLNAVPPERMPYTTALGRTFDSGEFAAIMDAAMVRADWAGFPDRRRAAAACGMLRGIGLATYVEACGGGGDERAWLSFDRSGRAEVLIGNQSTGQGHQTAFAQMVAAELGMPIEDIAVIQGDTDRVPSGKGTGGSRSLAVGGASLGLAVDAAIAAGRRVAARVLEAADDRIDLDAGTFRARGTNRTMAMAEVVAASFDDALRPDGVEPGLAVSAAWKPPASTFPNGCHVCEVEIDPATGEVRVVRYTIVDDVGVTLNPLLLEGQIIGGAVQGIGQALWEEVRYEPDSGQLLTGTFMDYAMPRADRLPSFDFSTRNVPCRTNLLGVKGAGEAGTVGAAPAVVNAVVDALAELGIPHLDMPLSPARVWRAIAEARSTR